MSGLAFVGAGEVARIFASGIREHVRATGEEVTIRGYTAGRRHRPPYDPGYRAECAAAGIELVDSAAEALAGADIVFSSVVADQAEAVGGWIAESVEPGAVVVDLNATTPEVIRGIAAAVRARGARFVDASIMDTVPVFRMGVPLLLSGDTEAFPAVALGFTNTRDLHAEAGVASSAKVLRSVVMKALEASLVESFTAARALGIEEVVADSVIGTFDSTTPGRTLVEDLVSSQRLHARRRAAEMDGAVRTLEQLGVGSSVSAGTRDHLRRVAAEREAETASRTCAETESAPA
ncbi:DUF1932 domain-containing protein [Brevibacterium litoralis]|uniref:DUF1932 domain-containing protein n=1 Tax=Brevibacterium litoralis TaxID=3138935 RepID=UPI0032F06D32